MELKERGAKVEMIGQQAEVEPRAQRPKVELGNPLITAELKTGKPKVDPSIRTELPKRSHRTEESQWR